MGVLPACMSVHCCIYAVCTGQKMVLDPLELEVNTGVRYHNCPGNET